MAKHSEDKIKLIQLDYENGKSISELSLLYGVSQGTIKYWSSNNRWVKKKQNQPTKKPTNRKKKNKTNQKKVVGKTKDIQIKQDILSDVPKEVIMEKHGIKKSAYYEREKSVRELRLSKTEKYLDSIIEMVYPDLEDLLTSTEKVKRNLFIRTVKEVSNDVINFKRVDDYNKTFDIIKNMSSEIMKTGKIVNTNSLMDIEQQITNEDIQKERLEIERSKLNDKAKETENESKSLDLLNKLVGDKNATNG